MSKYFIRQELVMAINRVQPCRGTPRQRRYIKNIKPDDAGIAEIIKQPLGDNNIFLTGRA
jgi:hypothetical protein